MLRRAVARPPCQNFAMGLTSADLGPPDLKLAISQHEAYCRSLIRSGLELIILEALDDYPDSTFVEDAAIILDKSAVITLPGAPSRQGEITSIANTLASHFSKLDFIERPGAIDGGDVCRIESHFLIGISDRTNEDGADQLRDLLRGQGYSSNILDIREFDGLLHLKSGVSYPGDGRILTIESLAEKVSHFGLETIMVPEGEEYAANCIRINDYLLTPQGFPKTHKSLEGLGYDLIKLDMSEFQKMDGGLSCLSLRF